MFAAIAKELEGHAPTIVTLLEKEAREAEERRRKCEIERRKPSASVSNARRSAKRKNLLPQLQEAGQLGLGDFTEFQVAPDGAHPTIQNDPERLLWRTH